jgi:glycosyltransferase involved in cell wall biosynthesis
MACGTPVVATPNVHTALRAKPGRELLVAAAPEAFARAVDRIRSDRRTALRLARAARSLVERVHSDRTAFRALDQALSGIKA